MPNLKDTDIDDLFRRASDKYPLRTDSADWDRMAAALENRGPELPDGSVAPQEKRKRRFFWLFLLLLPLAGAGYYTWHHATAVAASIPAISQNTAQTQRTAAPATTPATAPAAAPAGASAGTPVSSTPSGGTPAASGPMAATPAAGAAATRPMAATPSAGTPAASTRIASTPAASIPVDTHTANGRPPVFAAAHSRQHHGSKTGITHDGITHDGITPDGITPNGSAHDGPGRHGITPDGSAQDRTTHDGSASNDFASGRSFTGGLTAGSSAATGTANAPFTNHSAATGDRLFYDLLRAPISRDYRLAVNVTAPAANKDPEAKSTAKKAPTAKANAKTKHFYAGIFGSPDLSTVKMQSVKGVGSTFGVILGYTFNGGRWAIETGASVDRKNYYTDGEYFNTKEVRLPYNSWLTDVSGVCYMWEIPLNVRYNFNPGAKTSWFATAGFSTYLMSHEKYAYGLEWPGSSRPYDSTWNIHKPSQYPFSIINLSAGFEQRLGKIGNLRVEPYVRVPLTGLGTGKLPIMSAGVNIGITRQLW